MRRLTIGAAVGLFVFGLVLPAAAEPERFLGRTTREWLTDLKSRNATVRRSAAFSLGRMGVEGWFGILPLTALLQGDDDASVREMAASALGDIAAAKMAIHEGPAADPLEPLQKALDNDASPRVRRSAAYALGCYRQNSIPALDSLRKALRHADASVRQNAAWALGQISDIGDDDVNALMDLLHDPTALVRRDGASALKALGKKGAPAVGPLLAMIAAEKDDVVIRTGLDALARLAGPQHRDLSTAGLERLLLPAVNPDTQRAAAIVLARIGGPKAALAVTALTKMLSDPDVQVQELAAAALAGAKSDAAPAVEALARALKDSRHAPTQQYAAIALGRIGPDAKPAVPILAEALQAKDLQVRRYAAEALGQLRYPTNEEAVPALLKTIEKDKDCTVRQRCVWALFNLTDLDRDNAREILTRTLDERDIEQALVRYDAARLLANHLKADAPDRTVDVLLDMLNNNTLKVFLGTGAKVSGSGTESTKGQTGIESETAGDARYMAAEALGWLDKKVSENAVVIQALKTAAKDRDKKLSEKAENALKALGK